MTKSTGQAYFSTSQNNELPFCLTFVSVFQKRENNIIQIYSLAVNTYVKFILELKPKSQSTTQEVLISQYYLVFPEHGCETLYCP